MLSGIAKRNDQNEATFVRFPKSVKNSFSPSSYSFERVYYRRLATMPVDAAMRILHGNIDGLTPEQVSENKVLKRYDENVLNQKSLLNQLSNSFAQSVIAVLTIFIVFVFLIFKERTAAALSGLFALVTLSLRFFQVPHRRMASQLFNNADLATMTTLRRTGKFFLNRREVWMIDKIELPLSEIVTGDLVMLRAGGQVATDVLLIEAKELLVSEILVTGDSSLMQKSVQCHDDQNVAQPLPKNICFAGSVVVSGTGTAIVIRSGASGFVGKSFDNERAR